MTTGSNNATSATERMRIESDGKVGIGTSSPAYALDCIGSTYYRQIILADNKTNVTAKRVGILSHHYTIAEEPIGLLTLYNDASLSVLGIGGGGGGTSQVNMATDIEFYTGPNPTTVSDDQYMRMTIDETGNVGIGEPSPAKPLHITGASPTIRLEHSNDNGYAEIYTSAQSALVLDADPGDTDNGTPISFKVDGTEAMRIDESGDVTVSTGNLVIGTADKGISFSNAGDVGDSETVSSSVLDDYEVGYATATITAANGGGTVNLYSNHDAISYVKVGNLVTITGEIAVESISDSPSGQIQINMPFTGGDLTEVGDRFVGAVVTRGIPYTADVVSTCVRMTTGLSYICIAQTIDNGSETHIGADVLAQYDEITFTITIMVA
jgi:hypothetical protein